MLLIGASVIARSRLLKIEFVSTIATGVHGDRVPVKTACSPVWGYLKLPVSLKQECARV